MLSTSSSSCPLTHPYSEKLLFTGVATLLVAQSVKNLPAVQETQVRSVGRADPGEKEVATRTRILAWEIIQTEEPGRLQCLESQDSDMT